MKTRTLGRTGFKVSEIGLGAWPFGNNGIADYGEIDAETLQYLKDNFSGMTDKANYQ